ncbi:MAG: 23S rRNA (adenine(2503)-C(2))-methyltransferase RlmN [Tepidisphaerales bacterium]
MEQPQRTRFFDFTPAEWTAQVTGWGWPAFRARQVLAWVYGKLETDVRNMTDLSAAQRQFLAERVAFADGRIVADQLSTDGTRKLLIEWAPTPLQPRGAHAETVMIPDRDRRTACVSSQVGCPVGCRFCASGVGGVKGNLTSGQIVEQFFHLSRLLAPEKLTNVVFMGMGEPLANYAEVMKAIRTLHDPQAFHFGARRITVSTVGVPQRIRQLADEDLPLNLAISLHAPSEPIRRELIPWAEHFSIDEILDAARYYFQKTGREITLEYILLAGVNDRPEHARALAKVCQSLRANVNLLRYNEVAGTPFRRPTADDVVVFQDVLRHNGVNAHVRKSRGRDIDAACGQLRKKREDGQLVPLGVPTT